MHVTYIGCVLTAVEPCLYLTMSPMCCGKVNQTTWFRTQRQYFSGKCIALHFATKSELAQQHKLSIVHQSKDGFAYAAAGCTKPNTTVKPLGGHRTARNQVDLFSSLNRIESNAVRQLQNKYNFTIKWQTPYGCNGRNIQANMQVLIYRCYRCEMFLSYWSLFFETKSA